MNGANSRRDFLRRLGLSAAAAPFVMNAPSLGFANQTARKQRLVVFFSPDGTIPATFWPDKAGADFEFKEILKPLEPLRDYTLVAHGVHDRVRGDGDNHMRGMGCLLTGIELFPGNIQGGSDSPAGWASGVSIDQEVRKFLQANPATRTRFGSLEFGVLVPDRADTWTRMVYDGPNRPLTPIDDPYQMFAKLYGEVKDRENFSSVLDGLQADLAKLKAEMSESDRALLDQQETFVRQFEQSLSAEAAKVSHPEPELELGVDLQNDNMPKITEMQLELLWHSLHNDFTRVATFQFTNSVGQPRMKWLGIDEGQHALSHEPDSNEDAQQKLTKINRWYCEQIASFANRLAKTPEPGGSGSLLDNTLIVWTNELGKGNSHTLNNIPFVMIGGGLDWQMGQSLKLGGVAHNRLLMAIAHGFGHRIETFGNPDFCGDGALAL